MQEEDEMALVEAQLADTELVDASPLRVDYRGQPSLLEQAMPGEEDWSILNEVSFEAEVDVGVGIEVGSIVVPPSKGVKGDQSKSRSQNAGKENLPC